jgi:catalase
MVSGLMNVAPELAEAVAEGLGIRQMPAPMPKTLEGDVTPEVTSSSSLSLFARPGSDGIRTRRIAILVADGCDVQPLTALAARLTEAGAVTRFIGGRLGAVTGADDEAIEVDAPIDAAPSVLHDAVVIAGGEAAASALIADGRVLEFVKYQYRHCKTILAIGEGEHVLAACDIDVSLPGGEADPGIIVGDAEESAEAFIAAVAMHRHFARESDPPRV